jgi:hypothetical protein
VDDRVFELLEEFAAARARGDRPDPISYLERAGEDADALRDLIDALLVETPPPAPAGEVVAMMNALVAGDPPLLGARLHRRMAVDAVVDALVGALRLDPGSRERVKLLYQRLEGGLLDGRRLDPRLRAALADTLGLRPRDITLAGAGAAPGEGVVYARSAEAPADIPHGIPGDAAAEAPGEIDRLFGLGG